MLLLGSDHGEFGGSAYLRLLHDVEVEVLYRAWSTALPKALEG